MIQLNINDIISSPVIVGCISVKENCGAWNGSDTTRDIAADIIDAMFLFKCPDKSFYLLVNDNGARLLEDFNYDRVQFWKEVVLALYPICNVVSEINSFNAIKIDLSTVLKDIVIRRSDRVPDGVALLVSGNNNVVIIETG